MTLQKQDSASIPLKIVIAQCKRTQPARKTFTAFNVHEKAKSRCNLFTRNTL